MQTEVLIRTPGIDPAINETNASSYADDIGKLSTSLAEMRRARTPDSHALAVEAALNAATPTLHRIASMFAAGWPSDDVVVENLVHEVLFEVAASLDSAPLTRVDILNNWLSTLAFATLHIMWCNALGVATEDLLARAHTRERPAA